VKRALLVGACVLLLVGCSVEVPHADPLPTERPDAPRTTNTKLIFMGSVPVWTGCDGKNRLYFTRDQQGYYGSMPALTVIRDEAGCP
jgi:hypothetical protein